MKTAHVIIMVATAGALLLAGTACQGPEDRRASIIGHRYIATEKYGTMLPEVTQVDLYAFAESNAKHLPQFTLAYAPGEAFGITNHVVLSGRDAEEFAAVWRSQRFNWSGSMCFEPGVGIRFKTEGGWAFETAVCLRCRDFSAPVKGQMAVLGFGYGHTNFTHLSNILARAFPVKS